MKTILLSALVLLAGCEAGPAFNHANADDGAGAAQREVADSEGQRFFRLGVDFALTWQNGCPSRDACSFDLALRTPLPEGATVEALLWMPSMGHGSSPIKARQVGQLAWEFTDVHFIMAGKWQLKLRVMQNGAKLDETILDYRL